MQNYIIYPETYRKLEDSKLSDRVTELKDRPYHGMLSEEGVVAYVKEIMQKGYFKTFSTQKKGRLQDLFQKLDHHNWNINRNGNSKLHEARLEDVLLFTGWYASHILSPDDINNYKKFGFDSVEDFVGVVGADIMNNSSLSMHNDPHIWTTNTPDGRTLKNIITGSSHADLVIEQTDITTYETTNPMGTRVGFRPVGDEDKGGVYACHSIEGKLLVSLIKYAEQCSINSQILGQENAPTFLRAMNEHPQFGGSTAEHLIGFDGDTTRNYFHYFIDMLTETAERNVHSIPSNGNSHYDIIINDGNLIFKLNGETKTVFYPSDQAIRGLFIQAANGLGRTSVRELKETLAFRYSNEFKELEKRFSER